jgi:hypothetical protein
MNLLILFNKKNKCQEGDGASYKYDKYIEYREE